MINCWDGLITVLHRQELRSCTSRTIGDWVFDRLNSDGTINKSGRNHKHVGLWPKMTHMGLTENWRFTMIYPLKRQLSYGDNNDYAMDFMVHYFGTNPYCHHRNPCCVVSFHVSQSFSMLLPSSPKTYWLLDIIDFPISKIAVKQ